MYVLNIEVSETADMFYNTYYPHPTAGRAARQNIL